MPLPTLDVNTYETTLPSTGQTVRFRPFLVKEYKILLTALDTDQSEITRIVNELIDVCTFNQLDISKLAHFDTEFLFLQLRAKSIGEITELNINCDCGEKIRYDLNLNDVVVKTNNEHTNKIKINDNIGVIMRYPKFEEIVEIYENLKTNKLIELISNCIETVYDDEQVYNDFNKQEIIDFVSGFTKEQFDKLENFFATMPRVAQNIKTDCTSCGKHHEYDLEGLQNFFV